MNKKVILIIIAFIAIFIIGRIIFKKKTFAYNGSTTSSSSSSGTSSSSGVSTNVETDYASSKQKLPRGSWYNDGFPLKLWSSGARVEDLQKALNVLIPVNLLDIDVDGLFGKETEDRLYGITGKRIVASENDFKSIIANASAVSALF